jgi:type VI secretion system secreted protein VgrG
MNCLLRLAKLVILGQLGWINSVEKLVMSSYSQAGRPLILSTPLGKDVLFAVGFHGRDGLSHLYRYFVDAKCTRQTNIPFEGLMGQPISVKLAMPNNAERHFHGICVRITQGESDPDFTHYQLEVVPKVWLLTKKTQSRIFQHVTVPDILKKVFAGYDVEYQLSGKYEPRDFCVQYRETDFNFAARLMEEEGIFYFFKHAAGAHPMVISDTPQSHPAAPGKSPILFKTVREEAATNEDHIAELIKSQEQVSGDFVLWDHTFEKPHQNLEAKKPITDAVTIGKVSHKLKVGDTSKLEVYDWPGEYAQRFDGVNKGGSPQPQEVEKVLQDNKRTVDLRMQQEAATAVSVVGNGSCRQMTSGYKFSVSTLPSDITTNPLRAEGEYVLTSVSHLARVPASYRSGEAAPEAFQYTNSFSAIPASLPFRPSRTTPKPVISGSQTAQVVGPAGEEIFTDKYGRIKVQFHWDREGKRNADSSCWVRVAQISAGRGWGGLSIPRIGQEVVINFLEGDPDQPICVGCVYNPDQMPLYTLPDEKTKSYIRTNSSLGGVGYNAIRFEDKNGEEQVYQHAQKDMDVRVRNDSKERIGVDRHLRVGFHLPSDHLGNVSGETKKGNQYEEVAIDQHLKVHRNKDEHIGGDSKLLIGGIDGPGNLDIHIKKAKKELIDDTSDLIVKKAVTEELEDTFDQTIKGDVKRTFEATVDDIVAGAITQTFASTLDLTLSSSRTENIGGDQSLNVNGAMTTQSGGDVALTIGGASDTKIGSSYSLTAGGQLTLQAGSTLVLECSTITLKGGGGFITISPAGVAIQGAMVLINSGGAAMPGKPAKPKPPKAPKTAKAAKKPKKAKDAEPIKPKDATYSKTGSKSN